MPTQTRRRRATHAASAAAAHKRNPNALVAADISLSSLPACNRDRADTRL
jgi:hypothetical protein